MGGQDMWKRGRRICCNSLHRSSRGATLVEVTIALIVLAFMVGSVPAAVLANLNTQKRANEIRVAENLTRSEFEYIKSQDYKLANVTYPLVGVGGYQIISPDAGFGLTVDAWPVDPTTGGKTTPIGNGAPVLFNDYGIQLITVTVYGWGVRPGQPQTGAPLLVSTNYKFAYER